MIRRRALTIGASAFLLGMFAVGHAMRPTEETYKLAGHTLDELMPTRFAGWTMVPQSIIQVDLTTVQRGGDPTKGPRPTYDEILTRSYRDASGRVVMFSLAYGRRQSQELRIHRPELCYVAQGFGVKEVGLGAVSLGSNQNTPIKRLMTESRGRIEPVSYWIRIGDTVTVSPWQTRGEVFRQGLQGVIPDGLLVRVSSIVPSANESGPAFDLQERFLSELIQSLGQDGRQLLVGA
jgi:EpsI family protein